MTPRSDPHTEAPEDRARDILKYESAYSRLAIHLAEDVLALSDRAVAAEARATQLGGERDATDAVLSKWFAHYPEDIFLPLAAPQVAEAVKAIQSTGITSDALYGGWARHILFHVMQEIKAARLGVVADGGGGREEQIVEETGLLCGHWTFYGTAVRERVARCDLPAGHEGGMHRYWTNPSAGESYTWNGKYERHTVSAPPASVPSPPEPARDPRCVEAWPECQSGAYDPRCCRFPKSCSCQQSSPGQAG